MEKIGNIPASFRKLGTKKMSSTVNNFNNSQTDNVNKIKTDK
jgi:hypothetical protein